MGCKEFRILGFPVVWFGRVMWNEWYCERLGEVGSEETLMGLVSELGLRKGTNTGVCV